MAVAMVRVAPGFRSGFCDHRTFAWRFVCLFCLLTAPFAPVVVVVCRGAGCIAIRPRLHPLQVCWYVHAATAAAINSVGVFSPPTVCAMPCRGCARMCVCVCVVAVGLRGSHLCSTIGCCVCGDGGMLRCRSVPVQLGCAAGHIVWHGSGPVPSLHYRVKSYGSVPSTRTCAHTHIHTFNTASCCCRFCVIDCVEASAC